MYGEVLIIGSKDKEIEIANLLSSEGNHVTICDKEISEDIFDKIDDDVDCYLGETIDVLELIEGKNAIILGSNISLEPDYLEIARKNNITILNEDKVINNKN